MKIIACLAFLFLLPSALAASAAESAASWSSRSILSARDTATISAEIGARVVAIHFQTGEAFAKGDSLIEFDDRLPAIRKESAQAAHDAAEAELEAAERMLERNSASRLEVETARKNLAEARARLEEAEIALEACDIRAPFAGRVVELLTNVHELVPHGANVIRIANDNRLLAHFIFPENLWGTIAVGDAMPVEVPLAGVRTTARAARVSSGIDPASHTFELWADVDNADGRLRTGMTAILSREGTTAP